MEKKTIWQCHNPECNAQYTEYVNGCPKCATGEPGGSHKVSILDEYHPAYKTIEQGIYNPDLLKAMQEAEATKEDDLKKVKDEVGKEYSPATCEHKLPNGFSSWMFHSETSGSGPDFYHDVSVCVCIQCGTIRVAGFRQGKDGKLNRFNEEIDIHAEEAIDAIIKYANYIREENVWGRINQTPAEAERGKDKLTILKKHYFDYYRPSFPSDERTTEVVNQALCIKEETEAILRAMDEYAGKQQGAVWVKASERLPEKDGYYCFKANGGYMGAYLRTGSNGNRWWCDSAGGTIRNWKNYEWLDEIGEKEVSNG